MKRALLALLLLWAAPAQAAPLKVAASFSILADMAAQVGGDLVTVTSFVGPAEDAHMFQPAPRDARVLAGADVIVLNGLGFEGWMGRLVEATGAKGVVVTASDGIEVLSPEGAPDPHGWQDARNGVIYARNIAEGFCRADAAHCADYRARAATYGAKLMALDAQIRQGFAAIPEARRKVITSHDAFGYFGRAYGVALIPARGVSSEAEPSAAGIARLMAQIKAEGARALFVENISDPRLIRQIAADTGIRPGGELYSDALSAPDGPAADYLALLAHNAGLMTRAMQAGE